MARIAGTHSKKASSTALENCRTLVGKIFQEWLQDPDPEKRREGAKVMAPYLYPRLQTTLFQGDKDKPLVVHFDKDDAGL